ncbi:hypothetical protein V6N13_135434 [Hibiscus sabdariffa]
MARNVPSDHYLHIYIVEVEPESRIESDSNLEDEDCDVEPETRIESDSNSKEVESETMIESDSNSEDEEYEAEDESSTDQSKFSDSENELASSEDEMFNVNVGLGSDEVEVESLDGCHLKGYYQGHLLTAVGIDANDSIYPISFAVVESENQSSWCWFLELLATDLEIENSHSFTFMTDRQKGLMDDVPELFPCSAHRTCVRHLYSNAKTSRVFIGKALKDHLWKAARATYVTQFQSAMDELKVFSEKAWQWLSPKDPTHWSKSHFSLGCKSDMLLNNNCECFNKLILEGRDKPIVTLIESIRTKLMQRLAKRNDQAEKWTGLLCPKIQKKLDNATSLAHNCWPLYAGGQMYQVSCGPSSQHSVNIQEWTCSCRKWQLTGIPCIHAISVILLIEDRPEKYVDSCYSVSTQRAIYSQLISPVRGEQQWATNDTMEPILPPMFRRPQEDHTRKEKREADEAPPMTGKVSKRGIKIFCKKYGGSGHNIRTCKGKVGANPKRSGQTSSSTATRTPRIPKLPQKTHARSSATNLTEMVQMTTVDDISRPNTSNTTLISKKGKTSCQNVWNLGNMLKFFAARFGMKLVKVMKRGTRCFYR